MKFAMRERRDTTDSTLPVFRQRVFHGAHSWGHVEIRGNWATSGPQPVGGDGGVPEEVAAIFDKHPNIRRIAFVFGDARTETGSVWSRMDHEVKEDETGEV